MQVPDKKRRFFKCQGNWYQVCNLIEESYICSDSFINKTFIIKGGSVKKVGEKVNKSGHIEEKNNIRTLRCPMMGEVSFEM